MAPKISTVFFDYGDTLVENRPTYLRRVTDLLGEFGYEREYSDVMRAFTRADYLVYVDLVSDEVGGEEQGMARFLNHFSRDLDLDIDWPAMLPQITAKFEQGLQERSLCEGAVEMLEELEAKGFRLGIISNNDGSCREKCEQIGIARHFEIIIDSTTVGVSKPSPKIFEMALEQMRVSPDESAHVGDMYGADVKGAGDLGIRTVWYNRRGLEAFDEHGPDHEVERLADIPGLL